MLDSSKTASKKISIARQQEYFVTKSNELIQKSRFSMTMQQNKIILYLISKIQPADTGKEKYKISMQEFCETCDIDYNNGKNYTDIKKAIKLLADKSVWIEQPDGKEHLVRWLNTTEIDRKSNEIEISFHEDMLPYLYDLRARYTQYCLSNVLLMQSKYAIRLYELLKSYQFQQQNITLPIEDLKKRLDAENYKNYSDFRRYVLEKAVAEINQYSDIKINFIPEHIYGIRSFSQVTFKISKKIYPR